MSRLSSNLFNANKLSFDLHDEMFCDFVDWVKTKLHKERSLAAAKALFEETFNADGKTDINYMISKNVKTASLVFDNFYINVQLRKSSMVSDIVFYPSLHGNILNGIYIITFGDIFKHYKRLQARQEMNAYPLYRKNQNANVAAFHSFDREKKYLKDKIEELKYEIHKKQYELDELSKTIKKHLKYRPITKGVFK